MYCSGVISVCDSISLMFGGFCWWGVGLAVTQLEHGLSV